MNEPLINGLLSFLITVINHACHDIRIVAKWTSSQTYSSLFRALTHAIAAAALAHRSAFAAFAITRFYNSAYNLSD
jgi:hypothetical protein